MRHEYYWKNARSKICNGESAHFEVKRSSRYLKRFWSDFSLRTVLKNQIMITFCLISLSRKITERK